MPGKLDYELTGEITEGGKSTVIAPCGLIILPPCHNGSESYAQMLLLENTAHHSPSASMCICQLFMGEFSWLGQRICKYYVSPNLAL